MRSLQKRSVRSFGLGVVGLGLFVWVGACGDDPVTPMTPTPPTQPPPDTTTPPPTDTLARPATASSDVTVTALDAQSVSFAWTPGDGTGRVVLMKAGTPVDAPPMDGTTYTADSAFGGGDQVGAGNFVVAQGSDSTVTVTGLAATTTYHVSVFEFNADTSGVKYLTAQSATAARTTPPVAGLVGSWLWGIAGDSLSSVITFLSDSTYMVVDDGPADSGGMPGMERGTYHWDDQGIASGPLTANPITDTSGDWGLSDPASKSLHLHGTSFTFTIGPDASVATKVVASDTNPLVGSWLLQDPNDANRLLVITFLDDVNYMLGTDDAQTSNGGPGMERGTYSWNEGTGAFSSSAATDTNGSLGLSPLNSSGFLSVQGNTLTYNGSIAVVTAVRVQ